MPAFNIESCFGVDINVGYFNIEEILDVLEIKRTVLSSKRVKSLVSLHGRKERIVAIAMRQVSFDVLRDVLDSPFLPHDPYYVNDEKLLHTKRERLYDAQERFLMLCMAIATGRSVRSLKKLNLDISTKELRAKRSRKVSLFRYFRDELDENTKEYILTYKARLKQGNDSGAKKVDSATDENDSSDEEAKQQSLSKLRKRLPSKYIPTSFDDETETALKLFQDGHLLLSTQVQRFKRGEDLEVLELMKFCRRLIESHTRNNFSLMAIRHIKDSSTYLEQHAMGMAVLAIHFAKAMKLSGAYVEVLSLGALLFDLGRFRLPIAMITKTTAMTDGEFDLFRKHIDFGEQILKKCAGIPNVVYQMLYDHHEKVDGSGYPNGKQGQEISVYGKMAAIIDAYDAITSEQPHKPSMGPIKACQKLEQESGLAFDKDMLSIFLKSIGSVPVGSCVLLSNGRVGFVLTLNKYFKPSLVRQVYSMTSNSFIGMSDIELNKSANLRSDVVIEKEVDPQEFNLQFINHIS